MRVLHLSHGFAPECAGGVESYVADQLRAQRAAGIDSLLLAGSLKAWDDAGVEDCEHEGQRFWRLHRDDIFFDHWARLWHPGAERLVAALLERERPDLVHVHQWIRLTCNLVELAARLGIPAVVTLHDIYTSCPRCFRVKRDETACYDELSIASCASCAPRFGHESEAEIAHGIELFHDQYQAELGQAARVVISDEATAALVERTAGLPRGRVSILPMPYAPRFARAPRARTPRDKEPLRFAYWGNLTWRKGAQVLCAAFTELVREGAPRPAELHLFGTVDTGELDARLRELAGDAHVFFHGRYGYEELAAAGLHVAVFPTLCFETYGFVLDECYELGMPCIVTENGAMARRAGGAALVVPPNDVAALRAAMRRVLAEDGLWNELRARIPETSLSTGAHLARLRAVYDEAITVGPGPGAPIPASRRERLLVLQRESALRRICPEGGPS